MQRLIRVFYKSRYKVKDVCIKLSRGLLPFTSRSAAACSKVSHNKHNSNNNNNNSNHKHNRERFHGQQARTRLPLLCGAIAFSGKLSYHWSSEELDIFYLYHWSSERSHHDISDLYHWSSEEVIMTSLFFIGAAIVNLNKDEKVGGDTIKGSLNMWDQGIRGPPDLLI